MRVLTVALALTGIAACRGDSLPSVQAQQVAEAQSANISAQRRTAITSAVARVSPSVVTVQTEMVEAVPADFYEQFFGDLREPGPDCSRADLA